MFKCKRKIFLVKLLAVLLEMSNYSTIFHVQIDSRMICRIVMACVFKVSQSIYSQYLNGSRTKIEKVLHKTSCGTSIPGGTDKINRHSSFCIFYVGRKV